MNRIPFSPSFDGVITACVTPFKNDKIDFDSFGNFLEFQIKSGVSALLVAGTTGEAATLSMRERDSLIAFAVKTVKKRVPLLVGTGTNATESSVRLTKRAEELGADAALIVTPYYNKGTERGIIEHYRAIADATRLPILLYDVPSRTGVSLTLPLIRELAEIPGIVGIKEAAGDMGKLCALRSSLPDFAVFTGNDAEFLPALAIGARGVISVTSNLYPHEYAEIYRAFRAGETEKAEKEFLRLQPITALLFRETNPAPVKEALSLSGHTSPELRLPLARVKEETRELLEKELSRLRDPS